MPATISWRRREDGMIVVHDLPNGVEYAPMLRGEQAASLDKVEARWGNMCRDIGKKYTIPDPARWRLRPASGPRRRHTSHPEEHLMALCLCGSGGIYVVKSAGRYLVGLDKWGSVWSSQQTCAGKFRGHTRALDALLSALPQTKTRSTDLRIVRLRKPWRRSRE